MFRCEFKTTGNIRTCMVGAATTKDAEMYSTINPVKTDHGWPFMHEWPIHSFIAAVRLRVVSSRIGLSTASLYNIWFVEMGEGGEREGV